MNLIYFLLLLLLVFGILIFTEALRVRLLFDTAGEDMSMTLLWLKPFVKMVVTMQDSKPVLTLYLFNKRIFDKQLKKRSSRISKLDLIRLTEPRDVNIDTRYGFRDPYATGIACGVVNMASQFINIDSLRQTPDFMTDNDYIYFDATAKINIGTALLKMLKLQVG